MSEMAHNSGGNEDCQSSSQCQAGCGHYGSPAYDGLCSKCYASSLKRKSQNASPSTSSPTSNVGTSTNANDDVYTRVGSSSSCTNDADIDASTVTHGKRKASDCADLSAVASSCAATASNCPEPPEGPKRHKPNRCETCKKKVGLTGFECRCGGVFCAVHRYSDKHDCSFDYREAAKQEIRKSNPLVVGDKIPRL